MYVVNNAIKLPYIPPVVFTCLGIFVSLSLMLYSNRRFFLRYLLVYIIAFTFAKLQSAVFEVGRSSICGILATLFVFPYASLHEIDCYAFCFLFEVVISLWGSILTGVWDGEEVSWGVDRGDGKLRIPSALFESLFCACLLLRACYRGYVRGTTTIISYLLFRAINDHYRPSTRGQYEYVCVLLACVVGVRHFGVRRLLEKFAGASGDKRVNLSHRANRVGSF